MMLKFFLPDAGQVKENHRFPKTLRFRSIPAQHGPLKGTWPLPGGFISGFRGFMNGFIRRANPLSFDVPFISKQIVPFFDGKSQNDPFSGPFF